MPWHQSRVPPIRWKSTLIKLLRMEYGSNLVFSRVEIWWIDGWENEETCCLPSRRSASTFRHWRRRCRIRFVVRIQIILVQGEWSGAKKTKTILNGCNRRHWRAFCDMVNVHVFNTASICIHVEELLRQLAFHQEFWSHNETDVRHIWKIGVWTIRWDLWSEDK